MKISITLVHNKSDLENQAQIETLKSLTKTVEDIHDEFDQEGNVIGQFSTFHQEFTDLDISHEVKVYQVIPFGVTPPPNRYKINTGGIVEYGLGDEDKTGDHPRFFNWGLKRGTDNGADVSIYLEDVTKLAPQRLLGVLNKNADFTEDAFGKIASVRLLREKGKLKEDRGLNEAITEIKQRVVREVKNG